MTHRRDCRPGLILTLVLLTSGGALGQTDADLPLPAGAVQSGAERHAPADTVFATGVWSGTAAPVTSVAGTISQTAWRVPGNHDTSLGLMAPLRAAAEKAGWTVLLDCGADACGGFDFRYALPVLPEPAMHVDLGDYRYLSASRATGDGPAFLGLIVSRSRDNGFVQITTATPIPASAMPAQPVPAGAMPAQPKIMAPDTAVAAPVAPPLPAAAPADGGTPPPPDIGMVETLGAVALDDLVFTSGSADLAPGEYPSLAALAAWLGAHPDLGVTLVGHTDGQGALAANVALSKRRAQSVLERLADEYGIARVRLQSEGAGYLAPRASNLTEEGRRKNRRVEVMLTPTR